MKHIYNPLILFFLFQFSFGQIGFEESIINSDYQYLQNPNAVSASDIDGDGDIDIVGSSISNDKIVWFENINGLGNYYKPHLVSTIAEFANSLFVADLDNDGDMDILCASSSNGVLAWYENLDGQGNFGGEQFITAATGVNFVIAADIDNDGDIDIISSSSGQDKVSWYENIDSQGSFSSQQVITTSADGVNSIFAADIDSDGDIDLLSSSYNDDKIAWYENLDGLGSFGNQQVITTSANGANSVFAADIDSDGHLDVLISSYLDDDISWYRNTDGLGNFNWYDQEIISTSVNGPNSVFAADFDNDGDIDILSGSIVDKKIAWYENIDGLGNFSNQNVIVASSGSPDTVYAADINGDGAVDVLSPLGSRISWFENIGGLGGFGSQETITASSLGAYSVFSADIDGDGDKDVLSALSYDNEIAWYENINGIGGFGGQQYIGFAEDARCVFAADIDGDGDIDVLSASADDGKIAWYENIDGLGMFGNENIITTLASQAGSVYASDLDGDGDMDVLSASFLDGKIAWYENLDSQGTFGDQQIVYMSNNARSVHVLDADNDGDMDVLSVTQTQDGVSELILHKNIDGLGNFDNSQVVYSGTDAQISVYSGDIDGDGDLDLLSSSFLTSSKIAWYENIDGLGSYGSEQVLLTSEGGATSVHMTDLDGDNDLDVLSASISLGGKISWYENTNGLGDFGSRQIISSNVVGARDVYAADIDGDGDIDVMSASELDHKIVWYKNLGVLGNKINGRLKLDINNDGCDINDIDLQSLMIVSDNGINSFTNFTNGNGLYEIYVIEDDFTTQIENLPNYYTSNPVSQASSFVGLGNTDTIDFCIEPTGVFNDLNISIYPSIDEPRPGFDTTYQLVYKNVGTTQLNGSVSFEFDDAKIQFLSASERVSSQTSNTLNFDFTDLNPFETRTIDLEFNVFTPPITNMGDELVATATINPVSGDETEEDNVFTLAQTVIGSYDPNDIAVLEGEEITIEDADKYLHYLIRFQNTGTASAINVNVEHVLDDKLDWATMQLESLSHTGRVEIVNQTDVSFIFNNINLPDSTNDEPNSHGFIAFKIKPKSDVEVGDVFSAVADIYFDFNPPIITNTATTEIVEPLSINEVNTQRIQLFPNPAKEKLQIRSNLILDKLTIIDINGRKLTSIDISNINNYTLDISSLSKGIYFLEIQSGEFKSTKKFITN
ncbi:T9SS type A sorting domain-containing protein [Winogradskyella sp. R77965]|uniref:T9SS type A sorting domain-containing protein n=1 Tax=Winogradskyella sp. R77965 TaxID=3093872 RepID=UPI0037DCC778